MALNALNAAHAAQIYAGTIGRNAGHKFEDYLANQINNTNISNITPSVLTSGISGGVFSGSPVGEIIHTAMSVLGWQNISKIEAIALGGLATSQQGVNWLQVNGVTVKKCKSDVLLNLYDSSNQMASVGVSVKQCNNKNPTNAQLYFTTATAFVNLLRNNGISVSNRALLALQQFCGDPGFRPQDNSAIMQGRQTDPRRFFWEEIDLTGKLELENIFTNHQDFITTLLLQKAYMGDPFIPEILLHKTKKIITGPQEYALYGINDLVARSRTFSAFAKKNYSVKKGSYKDPVGVTHEAPRFGVVQMQRGGQAQHPTQLQFNLMAGYFYKI